ncbi:ATP-binding protein [Cellulomonas marina]|uniref:Histidine kinase-like ATPase domain-containing protein n=1 Tax=Cellulomonas marina TaxID=988821 RepID=A0A1I0Y1G1_9CELL|nr:ATP-binding protein [Cellulomonas marina]GIG28431.1 hypothetical protein Cma02nite_10310 [Cellulomonas marina]SFB06450.1 Histidine kinase-like ATPase domain-containing protein [Cellulomonas marina]
MRFWVLASVRQLQALRGELVAALTADGGQGAATREVSVASAMALVASELATNALEHGTPPTTVRLSVRGDTYLLHVADRELGTPPVVAGTRPAGDGGFGLMIAQRLAQDVGWYTTEQTKHVWATFSRSQQA